MSAVSVEHYVCVLRLSLYIQPAWNDIHSHRNSSHLLSSMVEMRLLKIWFCRTMKIVRNHVIDNIFRKKKLFLNIQKIDVSFFYICIFCICFFYFFLFFLLCWEIFLFFCFYKYRCVKYQIRDYLWQRVELSSLFSLSLSKNSFFLHSLKFQTILISILDFLKSSFSQQKGYLNMLESTLLEILFLSYFVKKILKYKPLFKMFR